MPARDHARVAIRPMSPADVPAAVAVHLAAFPGFFLSELGPAFLRELYCGFLRDGGVALVADDGHGLPGVVAGTCQPDGFFGRLLRRRWWAFGLASLPLLARRPGALVRLLRAVRYRGDASPQAHGALLSTICVDPRGQRGGVGTALVRAFLQQAAAQGAEYVYLMADAREEGANAFYRRLGFTVQETVVTPERRAMNRYLLPLEGARPNGDHPPVAGERPGRIGHQQAGPRGDAGTAARRGTLVGSPADGT
jgi:ribosomal protein S18 acetylase RimI-like enzyme